MCCEGLIDKFPQLNSCCCCCKVETGSKVIAWMGMIGAFALTVGTIFDLVAMGRVVTQLQDPNEAKAAATIALMIGTAMLLFLLFFWIMAIILLIGLYREDMGKVKVWLSVNICLFFFGLVTSILNIITIIFIGEKPVGEIIIKIIFVIFQVLFSLYMISVVKSHYSNKTRDA